MNKLLLVSFLALLVFLQTRSVLADQKNSSKKDRVEINSTINMGNKENQENDEDSDANEIKNDLNKIKTIIDKKEFEIKGQISALGTNSFIVNGQTIHIDPKVTGKVNQKGTLTLGAFAKVEGRVVDSVLYAKEIRIGNSIVSTTVTPSVTLSTSSLTITPSPTIETTLTTTITPTISATNSQPQKFILGEIIQAWEKILNLLKEIPRI